MRSLLLLTNVLPAKILQKPVYLVGSSHYRMEIKTTRLSTLDGLELKEATFSRQSFPDHFHDSYSIGIIEQGIERLTYEGKEMVVPAHSVVIINPYEIHANSFFDGDPWKYRTFYISGDVMKYMQRKMRMPADNKICFPHHVIDDKVLYKALLNFHKIKEIDKTEQLDGIMKYLLCNYAIPKNDANRHDGVMTEAANFLQDNYANKIIIDDLAARYGMDKYTFIRSFKKQTGLTPVSYLLLQRINKAKALIAQHMPIVEVALETGFYDQSHFTNYFRKYIGISPLGYKKGIISY